MSDRTPAPGPQNKDGRAYQKRLPRAVRVDRLARQFAYQIATERGERFQGFFHYEEEAVKRATAQLDQEEAEGS